ncbi:MAG: acyl-CoA synthetase [Halobacteriales archaeon]
MTWYLELPGDSYEAAYENFDWALPEDYNIAYDFLRKHEDPADRTALRQGYPDGRRATYSFAEVDRHTNRLAHALADLGVERGDRVAIMVPQKPAALFTHLACWKLGAVSVPLSMLFGADAVQYRLEDCDASVLIADTSVIDTATDVQAACPSLAHVIEVDGDPGADHPAFADLIADRPDEFKLAATTADTPAILMYTSGSTGPPKGVLHTHGVWVGVCPIYAMYFGQGDVTANILDNLVVYGHAEWAWIGSLGFTVLPAWHYGRPIVGFAQEGFDPARSFDILEEFGVTHVMFVPTALRMVMAAGIEPGEYDLALETMMSGSESVTPEIIEWVETAFEDVTINENYGQTEVTGPLSNCAAWFDPKPGSMGKPVPGSDVAVIDPETGDPKSTGEIGEIAVRRDPAHPGIFQEYWNDPERTDAARTGGWHLTGDLARVDHEGYFWFESRADDLIITSGYRVSPIDVEKAILEHEAVTQAGVIGVADERRGEVIKAYVETPVEDQEALADDVKRLVRDRMAKYAYPREIEVVEQLPKTVTGKIKRATLRERAADNERA